MYNLNVNVSTAGTAVNNLLAVESACTTPRTPEILNSLIAMTNPLDNYSVNGGAAKPSSGCLQNFSNDSNSSSSNQETYSANTSPPSVQHTCSQLIKAGLKLSIESKRKYSAEPDDLLDLDLNAKKVKKVELEEDDGDRSQSPNQGLTPEDEERRRRRRERNKIAATKCRLKKREKTVNLVHESEILETQNIDLKTQIQELESQRRRLVDMLTLHTPSCIKHTNLSTASDHYHINPSLKDDYIIPDEDASCYSTEDALPSVTTLAEHSCFDDTFSASQDIEFCSRANTVPTILIEGESYSPPTQLTDLDNSYNYNSQQPCHNYSVTTNGTVQNYNSPTMDNGCMA